jgi:NADH-quinone oxidoreductase subunit N
MPELLSDPTTVDLFALAPELSVLAAALLVLLVELFIPGERKRLVNPIGLVGVLVAIGFLIALAIDIGDGSRAAFGNAFVLDRYALLFKGLFLGVAVFVLLLSYRYFSEFRTYQGEYYFLLLSSFVGMLLMPSARDLVMLFIALEIVSIPGFVMAGLRKFDLRSNEGALKFFLIGVLSVAVLLFGLSIVYGFTGTTDLAGVAAALETTDAEPLLLAAVLFVIVGFGFKISAVPFHFWAPDTYQGSPVPVAAFLSVASKAAGFTGLIQVCFIAFEPLAAVWAPVLGVIAVLTMTLGNLVAMQQTNIVRLLAYSSVAHAGYMLVPFGVVRAGDTALNSDALSAVLVYLIAYAVMNTGAFAAVTAVTRTHSGRQIADYAGLGRRSPGLAAALSIFLLSLGGVPPLVGIWAKFYIFIASVEAATPFGLFLAAMVVVNSVIAMFYYLAVVRTMWMEEPVSADAVRPGLALGTAVAGLAVLTVGLFVAVDLFASPAGLATFVAGG